MKKECGTCGKPFETAHPRKNYCCKECSYQAALRRSAEHSRRLYAENRVMALGDERNGMASGDFFHDEAQRRELVAAARAEGRKAENLLLVRADMILSRLEERIQAAMQERESTAARYCYACGALLPDDAHHNKRYCKTCTETRKHVRLEKSRGEK